MNYIEVRWTSHIYIMCIFFYYVIFFCYGEFSLRLPATAVFFNGCVICELFCQNPSSRSRQDTDDSERAKAQNPAVSDSDGR